MNLENNTHHVNSIISRTLGWCFLAILALLITNWLGFFHFKTNLKAIIIIAGIAATIVPVLLEKFKVPDVFLKYYMLTALSVLIGLLGCNNGIGIYITYVLVPIASCLYFDRKFMIYIGAISYCTMTLGVYFNSAGKLEVIYKNWSHMLTFRNYMIGFTIEYLVVMLFLFQIVNRAQKFMENQQRDLKVLEDDKMRRDKISSLYKDTLSSQKRNSLDLIFSASKDFSAEDYTRIAAGHQYIAGLQGLLNYAPDLDKAYDTVLESIGEYFKLSRILYMEPVPSECADQLIFQWVADEKDRLHDFYTPLPLDEMKLISNVYDKYGYIEYGANYSESETFIANGLTDYMLANMIGRHLWLPTVADGVYFGAFNFDRKDTSPYSAVDIFLLAEAVGILSLHLMRQRAETSNKAKSVFLSTMSHEIRTPMNAILGMTNVSLREDMSDSLRSNLNIIKSSSEGLLAIINDILDFSKIESGKLEIVCENYHTETLVNDLKVIVSARNDDKQLDLFFDIDENLPSVLYGDMMRIKQVMINLCTNAIKYTKEGSIHIKLGSVGIEPGFISLRFSVKDTGQGIRAEDMDNLFKSFTQLNQEMNHHTEGSGLGLAISKQLVEQMKGQIGVDSTYGVGSEFYFDIPQKIVDATPISQATPNLKEEEEKEPAKLVTKDCHALIVDDNLVNLIVAKQLMEPFAMDIETATNGSDALKLTHEKKYDVIFMDHFMPEMDGTEVTERIRSDSTDLNCKTPIIALTADAVMGAKERMLAAGMDDFLSKPIDLQKAAKILNRLLPADKKQ